jgi:hypothetical protein
MSKIFLILVFKLLLLMKISSAMNSESSFWETANPNQQLELSDWDSTLYGKSICVKIPSKMSLCNNINYKSMKMPNLLGHETLSEIEHQSTAWQPLLSIGCHKDTQLFLCSLFAPVCIEQASQATIYPCRSLCESVKSNCEAPMLAYNYPWPSMFNCSQFPEDNGFCIQPSSQSTNINKPIEVSKKKLRNSKM